MKRNVIKDPKIALCRLCHGTGYLMKPEKNHELIPCHQCQGTGRVTVSGLISLDIRPYKPNIKEK